MATEAVAKEVAGATAADWAADKAEAEVVAAEG